MTNDEALKVLRWLTTPEGAGAAPMTVALKALGDEGASEESRKLAKLHAELYESALCTLLGKGLST